MDWLYNVSGINVVSKLCQDTTDHMYTLYLVLKKSKELKKLISELKNQMSFIYNIIITLITMNLLH